LVDNGIVVEGDIGPRAKKKKKKKTKKKKKKKKKPSNLGEIPIPAHPFAHARGIWRSLYARNPHHWPPPV